MQTNIRKWGNSAGALLPMALLKKIGLDIGDTLDIEVRGKEIVMTISKPDYTLAELLAATSAKAICKTEEDHNWLNAQPVGNEN